MEENAFCRTEYLIGQEALQKLKNSKVAIFGIGGVGSYVVEALARSGVGSFVLVDKDTVSIMILRFIYGYKFKEIASILEMTIGKVQSMYYDGLEKLRKVY